MFSIPQSAQTLGVAFLLASSWSYVTTAIDVDICATYNTGSTDKNTSIYQSNGLCYNFCVDDYAYAITQDNACWCSNYAPSKSTREDVSDCDTSCPGYPSEDCGGDGLYGYLSLGGVEPSGTEGPSSTSTSDVTTIDVISKVTETVQTTVTVVSSETSTSTSDSSSSSDDDTSATTGSSQVQTVTADGTVKTIFIGPTGSSGNSAGDNSSVSSKNSGLSTGEVVGIVVGVIGAVLIAASAILFFWFRRRKQQKEKGFQDDPSIRDSSSATRADMAGVSPISAGGANKRNSTLQVDPRMDPFKQGLYVRNGSRESINTLRDDHDYSRRIQAPKVLRATNPDPET